MLKALPHIYIPAITVIRSIAVVTAARINYSRIVSSTRWEEEGADDQKTKLEKSKKLIANALKHLS